MRRGPGVSDLPPRAARASRPTPGPDGLPGAPELRDVLRTVEEDLAWSVPFEDLLADPAVSDILVNGPGEVWIDRGSGLVAHPLRYPDSAAVARLAMRLVTGAGRRLDAACPLADVTLPGGHRLHAVLPPISPVPLLSVRVARARPFTLAELVEVGAVSVAGAALLGELLRARLSVVVSGGTGSGKTTVLGALLSLLDASERVVLVEDPPEIRARCPHLVSLRGRPANAEGAGAITQRDLVREALRMRPSRLVVGEVRGPEVLDLLVALNTGHEGGLCTVHANRAADVPARFEALGALGGLPRHAVHSLLRVAVQAVVHLGRAADGQREVREIGVLTAGRAGRVVVRRAAGLSGGLVVPGPGAGALGRLLGGAGPWRAGA